MKDGGYDLIVQFKEHLAHLLEVHLMVVNDPWLIYCFVQYVLISDQSTDIFIR